MYAAHPDDQMLLSVHSLLVRKARRLDKALQLAERSWAMELNLMFDRVLQINPQNWNATWLVGKAHHRLREFDPALDWFCRAQRIVRPNADVLREAAITAMELGRPAEAISFCLAAIEAKPDDPGLRSNLALATLFSGNAAEAASLAGVCREVLEGKRACLAHVRDITAPSHIEQADESR
jgi:tetratricopeptide (TPR) repeat protein